MVAAEAAAAGCLHSLATRASPRSPRGWRRSTARFAHLVAFEAATSRLRAKLEGLLALTAADREAVREAGRRAVVARWSWTSVAERLLAPV